MGQYKKFMKNTLLLTIGSFSSKILTVLLVPLYTSVLTTEEYGTYDLITTTVLLLTPLLTLDICEAVLRFALDKKKYNSSDTISIGLLILILGTILLVLLFPFFSFIDFFRCNFLWILLYFIASNFYIILTQYLKGLDKVNLYTICGVLSTFLIVFLNIIFLLVLKFGLIGYFLAYILSYILVSAFIVFKISLFSRLKSYKKINKKQFKEMVFYSLPMIPNSISWWISNSSDKYMIALFTSSSLLGIYSVSYKIPSVLTMITGIISSSFQLSVVEDFGSKKSKNFFENMYGFFSSFNIIIAALLILFLKPLAFFLYQKEFFEAWKSSLILVFAFVFNFLSGILGTIYTSAKKTKYLFYSTLFGAIVNIIFNYFLIVRYGIIGAAIATLVSYMVVWFWRIISVDKILKFEKNLKISFISYLLVSIEIVLLINSIKWSFVYSSILVFVIMILNFNKLLKIDVFNNKIKSIKKKIIK